MTETSLGWPAPPRPTRFDPMLTPPSFTTPTGVECVFEVRLVSFWQDRPKITPRQQHAHTNGALGPGSIESSGNWAHARPNLNTLPHYQLDRIGRTRPGVCRAAKMLPTDRRGIGSSTVNSAEGVHGDISWWALVFETQDEGWGPGRPGGDCHFDPAQGEMLAALFAYESIVAGGGSGPAIPFEYPTEWWGAGSCTHTEPFTFPFTTLFSGKQCPGWAKKADVRDWILPRAREIAMAWLAPEPVTPPAPVVPAPDPVQEDPIMFIATTDRQIFVISDGLGFSFRSKDQAVLHVQAHQRAGRPMREFGSGEEVTVASFDRMPTVSDRLIRAIAGSVSDA